MFVFVEGVNPEKKNRSKKRTNNMHTKSNAGPRGTALSTVHALHAHLNIARLIMISGSYITLGFPNV